jgi:GNAT superfamily N-acetyltransferase
VIRPLRPADGAALLNLCAAHAAYERAPFQDDGQVVRWTEAFFADPPRAHCLVVDAGGALVGYVSWSFEFSTWRAAEYVHVDCLYLEPAHRGQGLGRALLAAVTEGTAAPGRHLEWQTPAWSQDAVRFYERLGARCAPKLRFTLAYGAP